MKLRQLTSFVAALSLLATSCGAGQPFETGSEETVDRRANAATLSPVTTVESIREDAPNDHDLVESSPNEYLAAMEAGQPLPACPPPAPGTISTPALPAQLLEFVAQWIDVPLPPFVDAMVDARSHDSLDGLVLGSGPSHADAFVNTLDQATVVASRPVTEEFRTWVFAHGTDELLKDRLGDRALVALLDTGLEATAFVGMVVLEQPNGSFVMVARCELAVLVQEVADYAARAGDGAYASLLRLATDDEELAAFAQGEPAESVGWEDLQPDRRQLDVELTPPEVLATLATGSALIYAVPEEWRGFNGVLCTRVALGWGPCTTFSAEEPGEPIELDLFYEPGESIEIWILNERARLDVPIVRLGSFSLRDASGELHLSVAGTWTTMADLVFAADRGDTIFEQTKP